MVGVSCLLFVACCCLLAACWLHAALYVSVTACRALLFVVWYWLCDVNCSCLVLGRVCC